MVAYSCNVSCRGCISVSDIKRDGIEPLADIVKYIEHWKNLIDPQVVALFGGEPLLHPGIHEVCRAIKKYWPEATIRLITNGYLLDNFFPASWFEFEPFEMQISIHRKDHETLINQHIKKILSYRIDWKTKIYGGADHKQIEWTSKQFKIYKSLFKSFIQPYRLVDNKMLGYGSDPVEAHAICGSPNTPILYKGALYKCPPVANLIDLTKEYFYGYKPITDSDGLAEFVGQIGKPETVCAWCPAQSTATVINHFDIKNVQIRQQNIG